MNSSTWSRRSSVLASKVKSMARNLPYGRAPAYLLASTLVRPGCRGARSVMQKPTRECRPSGPARAVGAGERPATTAGYLHNASIHVSTVSRLGRRSRSPGSSAGAAEDVDVAGIEDQRVDAVRVELGDEGGDVADGRGVVAVHAVEHDVLGDRVARVAEPEDVGTGGERCQQVQGGLHGSAAWHPGHGRVGRFHMRADPVGLRVPQVVQRELEGERYRDREHHGRAVVLRPG